MKTLTDQYRLIEEGKGNKDGFLRNAKRQFPVTDIIRKSIANVFNKQGGLRDSDVSIETITITPTPTNVGPDSDFGFNETITFNFDSAAV